MGKKYFKVIEVINNEVEFEELVLTSHWAKERIERHNKILRYIGGGNLIKSFVVDTKHPKGLEIHNVFDNGIVLIQNKKRGVLVTELIARPHQIKRYWEGLYMPMPIELYITINKAREHQKNGWNEW